MNLQNVTRVCVAACAYVWMLIGTILLVGILSGVEKRIKIDGVVHRIQFLNKGE